MPHHTIRHPAEAWIDPIKGSKFLGLAVPCREDELKQCLSDIRSKWTDVSHHCWGWIGASESAQKFSDDGEPSGSAGRPILNVLSGQSLRDTLVVVIRWYGGTKLGTGGLVRAYSAAANRVLEVSEIVEVVPMTALEFECPYDRWPSLEHQFQDFEITDLDLQFDTMVRGRFSTPQSRVAAVEAAIRSLYPARLIDDDPVVESD